MSENARKHLIRILQNAYAGELAAAFAYRGHWKSLKDSAEKEQIKEIEAEEWHHRKGVLAWLEKLEAKTAQNSRRCFLDNRTQFGSELLRFRLVFPDVFCRTARESKCPRIC